MKERAEVAVSFNRCLHVVLNPKRMAEAESLDTAMHRESVAGAPPK